MNDTTDPTATPVLAPSEPVPPVKPGWRTTEFWLKVAAFVLTALFASGAIPTSGTIAQVAAIAAFMLGALGYTVGRSLVKAAGAVLLVAFLLHTTTACGASQRQTTLKTATSGVDVAEVTLHAYDVRHQVELAEQAPNQATARAAVDAWKATRDKFDRDIKAAYKALLAASLVNDDPSLASALAAAARVTDELKALAVLK